MIRNRYFVNVAICCMMLWCMMTGCGVRDAALTIPVEEPERMNVHTESTADSTTDFAIEATYESGVFGNISEDVRTEQVMIYVYVCGAVNEPGVVELPEGSRADAALEAAGGFTEDAQTDYVNLAAKVSDGEKLYFPNEEEVAQQKRTEQAKQDGMVNINTADLATLMTLPGIGESKAQDIISYREEHGEFLEKEDLKKIPRIKENVYAKLCEKIVL